MTMRAKRSIRHLPLLAVLGVLLYAAAPALSTDPYLPGAVDFEQPLQGLERVGPKAAARPAKGTHAGEGPVSFRTAVIEAPRRFDLAGLAGETRPLELRGRPSGGEWSEWTEAADGNPVYFGGADELQLRARGWRPSGTLHYVNVSGTSSRAGSALTAFRESVNSAFVAAGSLLTPSADAAPSRPAMVTRGQWGASLESGGCAPREAPSYGRVKTVAVHHTVTSARYTAAEAPGIVLGICRYHRNANGWNDIGYNALVDRFGTLYAGRAGGIRKAVIGAHAQGFNARSAGIASIGTHTSVGLEPAELETIVSFLAWKLTAHALPAKGKVRLTSAGGAASRYKAGERVRLRRVIGHRDVGLTACPGEALYGQLAQIRRLTRQRIAQQGGAPPPAPAPPAETAPGDPGGVTPKPAQAR